MQETQQEEDAVFILAENDYRRDMVRIYFSNLRDVMVSCRVWGSLVVVSWLCAVVLVL